MSFPSGTFYDPGYDPTGDLDIVHERITTAAVAGPKYVIPATMLPPVGEQGTRTHMGAPPSCAAWASTYGLATAAAARAGGYNPNTPDCQASPAYIYIQVTGVSAMPCRGSSLHSYFMMLESDGTPNLLDAKYLSDCTELVNLYHNPPQPPPNDARFKLPVPTPIAASDTESVHQALLQNRPLAYGTGLYTDFGIYNGTPVPYVGNGERSVSPKTNKPAGHCMMIIGYDDTKPYTDGNGQQKQGAYRIQNSFGHRWGDKGYLWMAYETFLALAQGTCFAY